MAPQLQRGIKIRTVKLIGKCHLEEIDIEGSVTDPTKMYQKDRGFDFSGWG